MVKIKNNENKSDTLLGGAFALTLSVVIVKLLGFFYKLPLSRVLGDEGMGYFNSAYSVFAFFYMLCTSGVPRAVSITVTESYAKGNAHNVNKILGISVKLYATIGCLFTGLLMIFSSWFADLIGNSMSAFSLFCIAPSLAFVASAGVMRGYLNGKRRMRDIAISEVIEGTVKFVFGLTMALYAARKNMTVYMISAFAVTGVTIGTFLGTLFLFVCVKNEKKNEIIEQKECNRVNQIELIKKILRISLPITLSSAVMGISNIIDLSLIMKRLIGTGVSQETAVALYGNFTTLAVPMLNLVIALITPLGAASIPHLTTKYTAGEREDFSDICKVIITIAALLAFPISAAYLFYPNEILMLLFEDASAFLGAPMLAVLSSSVISMSILTVLNSILESTMHQKIPLISMTVGAGLKLLCGYIMIGKLGIIGAPLSTGICYAVALIISVGYSIAVLRIDVGITKLFLMLFMFSYVPVGLSSYLYNYLAGGAYNQWLFLLLSCLSAVFYGIMVCIFMRKNLCSILKFVKIAKK